MRKTGAGQQVDFVVDDEAPVALVEEAEVGELLIQWQIFVLCAALAMGENLVGGDGDGADFLALAGVLADHFRVDGGLVEEFLTPLTRSDGAGSEDERVRLDLRHCHHAHDGFACTAGQDDGACAARVGAIGPEDVAGVLLVVADGEQVTADRRIPKLKLERCSFDVADQVFRRIPGFDERLFDVPAPRRRDVQRVLADAVEDVDFEIPIALQFHQEQRIVGHQAQAGGVVGVAGEPHAPVARDGFGDFDDDVVGQRVLGVESQARQDDPRRSVPPTRRSTARGRRCGTCGCTPGFFPARQSGRGGRVRPRSAGC